MARDVRCKVFIESGPRHGTELEIRRGGRLTIGSHVSCQLVIREPLVLGLHASIEHEQSGDVWVDNFSMDRTRINSVRVKGGQFSLEEGDAIEIGSYVLRFSRAAGDSIPIFLEPTLASRVEDVDRTDEVSLLDLVDFSRPTEDGIQTLEPDLVQPLFPALEALENASGFVLDFLSGEYEGERYPLTLEDTLSFGRDPTLSVPINDEVASRHHAALSCRGGEVWVQDLESTNGTFVNGEEITKRQLSPGDVVAMGKCIFKLSFSPPRPPTVEAPLQSTMQKKRSPRAGGFTRRATHAAEAGADLETQMTQVMSGDFGPLEMLGMFKFFAARKKTGSLIVNTRTQEGRVYLREGLPIAATLKDATEMSGARVFQHIMDWTEGSYFFGSAGPDDMGPPEQSVINVKNATTLMGSVALLRELRAHCDDLPVLGLRLSLPFPLDSPLETLTPEQIQVFRLAYNHGQVSPLLDHCEAPEDEVLRDLLVLIRGRFLLWGRG